MLRIFTVIALVTLGALLVLEAGLSLDWRMVHDAPLLSYVAYGMSTFGSVPYVDLFDMNAPGAYYFHSLLGSVFGFGDGGFRAADLLCLLALLTTTWFILRRFGGRVAFAGAILFGLVYLGAGPEMSLQREFVALVPVSVALLISMSSRRPGWVAWTLVGALFGVAVTIKPAMGVGFPFVVVFGMISEGARSREEETPGSVAGALVFSVLGLLLPLALTALRLAQAGALTAFLDIAENYWPLYGALGRTHETVVESQRAAYLAREWVALGGRAIWFLPAAVGVLAAMTGARLRGRTRRDVLLLCFLTVCYCGYPLIAGKFWSYHWLPFAYFVILLSSLALVDIKRHPGMQWAPVAALVVAVASGVRPPAEFSRQLAGEEWLDPRIARADRIAAFLEENMEPRDTVQPLDWTGGAVHAMLLAGARPATPYIYDFHFYHHVSTDYIRELRTDLLSRLGASPPRYIIAVETMRPWVSGDDTERRFRALDAFIASNYSEAHGGFGYRVYERALQKPAVERPTAGSRQQRRPAKFNVPE